MSFQKKLGFAGLVAFLFAGASFAQTWGVGASLGITDDVTRRIHLDEFKGRDVNLWADYQIEEKVLARVTFGTLKAKGVNAGQTVTVTPGSEPQTLPDLSDKIDYLTAGVSYEFWEGYYTSGLFAGIGGYKIRPEGVEASLAGFRDQRESVFGFHAGVDGSFKIISKVALGARLTYHNIRATATKGLLTANVTLSYRF